MSLSKNIVLAPIKLTFVMKQWLFLACAIHAYLICSVCVLKLPLSSYHAISWRWSSDSDIE